ncbi:hypothetical protein GLYMA_11G041350v4 [Glycine max]|nr:hypothetical protein GLYMA_11G041350v4 [Glycine max]KAH1157533.1 hypothetical protein GYH30_029982 [Glycine max]
MMIIVLATKLVVAPSALHQVAKQHRRRTIVLADSHQCYQYYDVNKE